MLSKQGEDGDYEGEKRYYGSFTALRYLTAFAEYDLQKDSRVDGLVNDTVANPFSAMQEDLSGGAMLWYPNMKAMLMSRKMNL